MKAVKFHRAGAGFIRSLAVSLSFLLVFGQLLAFAGQRNPKPKSQALSDDQRIAHVLSRLTFGARPGDFERVKAMGVGAFINQQLDPDSLDAGAVIARLKKLPTLGMATPVIIEQYTPPKPVVVPSPSPAASPNNSSAAVQRAIAQNSLSATPQIANPNMPAMQAEMQLGTNKEEACRHPALPDKMKSSDTSTKPVPPESNVRAPN